MRGERMSHAMKSLKYVAVALLVLASMLPGAALATPAVPYTCAGGAILPGTYSSLTITGACSIPSGVVTVIGDVVVRPGASLNAALSDFFTQTASGDIVVGGDVSVGHDGILLLGCAPSLECPDVTHSEIQGSLKADRPLVLWLHGNVIGGRVSIIGGGGGKTCDANPALAAALGLPPFLPAWTTLETNWINGGVTISGMESCWNGFIRNHVRGAVTFRNNKMAHPDAMEIVTNEIRGSLACYGNDPAPQIGDSEGLPNVVTGRELGQCEVID
jgi:hypothetical protein